MDDKISSSNGRVMLWCAPRSTSNLFAKCLTAIEGNEIWIEPYEYAHYALVEMGRLGLWEAGREMPSSFAGDEEKFERAAVGMGSFLGSEILPKRLPYETVQRSLENSTSRYVFVKDMGNSMDSSATRQYLPAGYKHTFLIRHPRQACKSFRTALIRQLSALGLLSDNGTDGEVDFDITDLKPGPSAIDYFEKNYELWKYVKENIDPNPVVIDSGDLLRDPARILSKYCAAVGLPYSDSLLTWESTPESFKSWKLAGDDLLKNVKNFVGTLMNTTCFLPSSEVPSRDELSSDVIKASDAVMPYYNEMYSTRMH